MTIIRALFLMIFVLPSVCNGQIKSVGTPDITNYPKSLYKAGIQNWGIAQDANGFMYFANNDGLLFFDGIHWEILRITQSSAIRSVCIDKNNNIYAGFFNDFGTVVPQKSGELQFQSLRHLIPDEIRDFDDIWRIWETPFGIVFQSFDFLFILNNNKIKVIRPFQKFHFSFFVNNQLLIDEPGIGLFEFNGETFQKVLWADKIKDFEIWAVLPMNESGLLIATAEEGLYQVKNGNIEKWQTPANNLVKQNKLYSASLIAGNHYAFGTILGGVVISDFKGNVKHHINRKQGLQNNTVLSIFSDNDNNLWLGLDNGIDFIDITSPITFLTDDSEMGAGYCCQVFNGNLYIGTNQGLFVKPFLNFIENSGRFELVKNTTGQVWSLTVADNQLICGHNLGAFSIVNNSAVQIAQEDGAWKFITLRNHPDFLIGGFYNGLVLFKKSAEGYRFHKKLNGFTESSRFLCEDHDGKIWISHGSKGVYRVELNANFDSVVNTDFFNANHGLPSDFGNIVFEIDNKITISTINGFYQFLPDSNRFGKAEKLNQIFKTNSRIKAFYNDEKGNYWFIAEKESGVFRKNEDLTYTKITAPFASLQGNLINEFEFIYPYNDENIFIGLDYGVAHYSAKFPKSYAQEYKSYITKIEIPYIDSVLHFNQIYQTKTEYSFPFRKNEFRFHFASPFFQESQKLEFSYLLENYSEKWSDWSLLSFKDFINLNENEYTLKLKARNVYGTETEVTTFRFSVEPPWHRSKLAIVVYLVIFLLIVLMVIKYIRYRIKKSNYEAKLKHERELRKQEEDFQHQALIAEKEIIRLRNEKLQDEMVFRDKELANQTMNIIHKNKFLINLIEELHRLQSTTDDHAVKNKMISLRKRIQKEIDDKQQNIVFDTYFDEVHSDFFNRMKEKYPDLSPKELRLCAYIRMNISTKEISSLLNISYRGVEINRYRLRKKLDIARDTNLTVFLSNI